MIKRFILMLAMAAALCAAADNTADSPLRKAPLRESFVVSTGHNLDKPRAPRATKRNRVTQIEDGTALMLESFESCASYSTLLPDGWTSTTNLTEDDFYIHWYGISRAICNAYAFPTPADGNMMMTVFYDDFYKDEWIISPTVNIPSTGYELSYYWFTTPAWLYVCEPGFVDSDKGVFINRQQAFNFEVLIKEVGGEWKCVYDLESQYSHMEFAELRNLELSGLVPNTISVDDYAGKDIQIAFRYYGTDGDAFFLDAIRIDKPAPDAHYTPAVSRLYYGYTPDEYMGWIENSTIEFYPVCSPITWENTSKYQPGTTYSWTYYNLDDDGELIPFEATNPYRVEVTHRPDYTDARSLMNNFYLFPSIHARGANGAVRTYTSPSTLYQAGGTTEMDFGAANGGYSRFHALPFDINSERLGIHVEESEALGFFSVPIFGYSVNNDAWWEHYTYPNGAPADGYSYVNGFANMYFPDDNAPLVVKGVSALARGTIHPDAEFTMSIYTMRLSDNGEEAIIIESPIATKTIKGSDVVAVPSGMTRDDLLLLFPLDEPVIFSTEGTEYAYLVDITGYHDPRIEWFAPMQSIVPNAYEWCLGFYHHCAPYHDSLTDAMGYVAFFTTDWGEDLYTAFAIGLDAHYPWLMTGDGDSEVYNISDGPVTTKMYGYYDASEYKVTAPDWLEVSLQGRYTTDVTFDVIVEAGEDRTADVIIEAPGVSLTYKVCAKAGYSGIIDITSDAAASTIFNLQGIAVKRNATAADLDNLPAGIYIFNGSKHIVNNK